MITYWVQATQENAKLLGVSSGWVNKHSIFVVNQVGREIEGIQIVSDYVKQQILNRDFIPEYKYHEKTKQFIPANSKLFEKEEEDKQEKSVVKAPDFKIKVGDIVMVSPDSNTTEIAGSDVEVLGTFTFKNTKYVTVGAERSCYIVKQSELFPPFTAHEKKIKQFIQDNYKILDALTKFNVTREELAEFLLNKQNNQETK